MEKKVKNEKNMRFKSNIHAPTSSQGRSTLDRMKE